MAPSFDKALSGLSPTPRGPWACFWAHNRTPSYEKLPNYQQALTVFREDEWAQHIKRA